MVKKDEIVAQVTSNLSKLRTEVAHRNTYIDKRDDFIYGDRLMNDMEFIDGFDRTEYNWLERTVEIHTSQLMGRGLAIFSTYNKEDLSLADNPDDPQQLEQAKMLNKRLKINADARQRAAHAIIRDNGGAQLFRTGAQIASAYGFCVYKSWFDKEEKQWRISLLESPQNFWAGWSDDNFRERDYDAYVSQISVQQAYDLYGHKLEDGEKFATTKLGDPIDFDSTTTSPVERGDMDMVTVVEYTGKLPGWKAGKSPNSLAKCNRGEETEVNLLTVGGKLVQIISNEDLVPRYYIVSNKVIPRRPWGRSDVSDSCIEINRTYLERMSDWVTLANKTLFPRYKAIGFASAAEVPKARQRTVEVMPLSQDQDIGLIDTPREFGFEYPRLLEQLKEDYVRAAGISRVLFDDPSVNANSNQALMTTMKNTIDVVEAKQDVWERAIVDMLTDALITSSRFIKELRDIVDEDDDWHLYVQWPSVLRKEDPVFQQMLLNRFNANTMAISSFLEEQGVVDTGEEIDRIRDEMVDPTTAAIHGRQMGALSMQQIAPDTGEPEPPKTSISLRGDLTPYQEANLASQHGFNDGPFPPTAGPQGQQGRVSQENADNEQFIEGDPFSGGTPIQRGPGGQPVGQQGGENNAPNPQVTTANNQEGTGATSQPGSGQPAVSPQGAINQGNQQGGN